MRACTSRNKTILKYYQEKHKNDIDRSIQHFASPKRNKKEKKGKKNILRFSFPFSSTFFFAGVILDLGTKKKERRVFFSHFLIKLFSSGKGKKKKGNGLEGEKEPNGKGIIIFVFICIKNQLWDWRKRRERRVLTLPPSSSSSSFYFFFWKKRERVIGTPHAENGKKKKFFSFSWLHLRESVVCLLLSLLAKTITLQKAIIREKTQNIFN